MSRRCISCFFCTTSFGLQRLSLVALCMVLASAIYAEEPLETVEVSHGGEILQAKVLVPSLLTENNPNPRTLDLGPVRRGFLKAFVLPLHNDSESTIKIVGTTRSCSCAVATTREDKIPVRGESKAILVIRPTSDGAFDSQIEIVYVVGEGGEERALRVNVRGLAVRAMRLIPDRHVVNATERVLKLDLEYPLSSTGFQESLQSIKVTSGAASVAVKSTDDEDGRDQIEIELQPDFWSDDNASNKQIVLVTMGESGEVLEHFVQVVNRDRILIRPEFLKLNGRIGEAVSATCVIKGSVVKDKAFEPRCTLLINDEKVDQEIHVQLVNRVQNVAVVKISFVLPADRLLSANWQLQWTNGRSKMGESTLVLTNVQ